MKIAHLALSLGLLLLLPVAVAVAAAPPAGGDFLAEWKAWHARRLEALRRPQGWLALRGLHWLAPGRNAVPGLPGGFLLEGQTVRLEARPEDGYTLGGRPFHQGALASDAGKAQDRLVRGSRTAAVIERGGRLALRVWDADSPVRAAFKGIETYPPDPRWRITARWEPFPEPRRVEQPSVLGVPTSELAPGRAVFTVDGQEVALTPTLDDGELFFVFRDRTAPKETYGGGRFLTASAPAGGTVVLDFNRAVNPPCVFTPFATCPLPLPENVLPVRIEAGEKGWGGGH